MRACGPCWRRRRKGVEILEGRAEELPAADASYDVVTAQSAWHWVDESRAIPEVARVLRPGGRLALVWNGTDRSVDWMRTLWAGGVELDPEDRSKTDHRRRRRHQVDELVLHEWFIDPETKLFTWSRTMTKDELIALAATYSAVIVMKDEAKRPTSPACAATSTPTPSSGGPTSSTCPCAPTAGGPPPADRTEPVRPDRTGPVQAVAPWRSRAPTTSSASASSR